MRVEKPRVAELIRPHKAGRLINQVKKLAEGVGELRDVDALSIPQMIFCWLCAKPARPTIS
jgi:hypothetical protein